MSSTETPRPHTHRFDDAGICERCPATLAEVRAARAAAAQVPTARVVNDLRAAAAVGDARERKANRRSYYERTGR